MGARPGRRPSMLNEEQVSEARRLVAAGRATPTRLAQRWGVPSGTLKMAIRGDSWGWLCDPPPVTAPSPGAVNRRLSETDVITARQQVTAGAPVQRVAAELGVAAATVSQAVSGQTWRHLDTLVAPIPLCSPVLAYRECRLTSEIVTQARRSVADGTSTIAALARAADVHESTMRAAVRGYSWRHITDPAPVRAAPATSG